MHAALTALAVVASLSSLSDRPNAVVGPADHQAIYKSWLRGEAIREEARFSLATPCAGAWLGDRATSAMKIHIAGESVQREGLRESILFKGCGREGRLNLDVVRTGSASWIAYQRLPGESYGDVRLQRGALTSVFAAIAKFPPGDCKRLVLGETVSVGQTVISGDHGSIRLVAPGGTPHTGGAATTPYIITFTVDPKQLPKLDAGRSWSEVWPLRACGVDRSVRVFFLARRDQSSEFEIDVVPHWKGAPGYWRAPN